MCPARIEAINLKSWFDREISLSEEVSDKSFPGLEIKMILVLFQNGEIAPDNKISFITLSNGLVISCLSF